MIKYLSIHTIHTCVKMDAPIMKQERRTTNVYSWWLQPINKPDISIEHQIAFISPREDMSLRICIVSMYKKPRLPIYVFCTTWIHSPHDRFWSAYYCNWGFKHRLVQTADIIWTAIETFPIPWTISTCPDCNPQKRWIIRPYVFKPTTRISACNTYILVIISSMFVYSKLQ